MTIERETHDHWKATNHADEWSGPEPEPEEETEWEFYSGPYADLYLSIVKVRLLNDIFPEKFGVFPDPNTTTKWIIKRAWQ